jgi:hypothetical protein
VGGDCFLWQRSGQQVGFEQHLHPRFHECTHPPQGSKAFGKSRENLFMRVIPAGGNGNSRIFHDEFSPMGDEKRRNFTRLLVLGFDQILGACLLLVRAADTCSQVLQPWRLRG